MRTENIDLAGNICIPKSNNKTIVWSGIFVFVLNDQTSTGEVVSFTFSTSFKLDLEPFEVLLILNNFNKTLYSKRTLVRYWSWFIFNMKNTGKYVSLPHNYFQRAIKTAKT